MLISWFYISYITCSITSGFKVVLVITGNGQNILSLIQHRTKSRGKCKIKSVFVVSRKEDLSALKIKFSLFTNTQTLTSNTCVEIYNKSIWYLLVLTWYDMILKEGIGRLCCANLPNVEPMCICIIVKYPILISRLSSKLWKFYSLKTH